MVRNGPSVVITARKKILRKNFEENFDKKIWKKKIRKKILKKFWEKKFSHSDNHEKIPAWGARNTRVSRANLSK